MLIEQETSSLCFDLRQTYIIAQNCSIVPNHCDVEKNRTKHTKRSMAFSNGHLTSVIKRRSCLLFLGQTFLFVSLISWHHRWQKTVFFAFEFEFIILLEEGGGGGNPPENPGGDNSNKRCLVVPCITSSPPGNLLHPPDFSLVMLPHNFRFPLIVNSFTIYGSVLLRDLM